MIYGRYSLKEKNFSMPSYRAKGKVMEEEKRIIRDRLSALRGYMLKKKLDAYIIVSDDFHGSEYVGEYFKCREFMSGFKGSAGTLLVTMEDSFLWTDGRYFIQAEEELKKTGIKLMRMGEEGVPTLTEFLVKALRKEMTLGYDGRTINQKFAENLRKKLEKKNIKIVYDIDLVDKVWKDRPSLSAEPVWELDEKYAGISRKAKLSLIRDELKENEADCTLIASLDDIAWIYNLRGNDIEYNPVALAYTIIYKDKAVLYINLEAVPEKIMASLQKDKVVVKPYLDIYDDVKAMKDVKTVMLSKETVNEKLVSSIDKDIQILDVENPSTLLKAVKNKNEIENERTAHILDGIALTRMIYYLKKNYLSEEFKRGEITELSVAEKLLSFRMEQEGFIEESFAPIIASGDHGAIIHYEPTKKTDRPIEKDTFLLMDTGGQYIYGTTDVTRTIALGNLSVEMKRNYTAVLKGHLGIASAVFKEGTDGGNLDIIARAPLWELGLDYNHGTGHGVGYLLNVHEGPNRISMRGSKPAAFKAGMITSNEPGVYLEGKYGIRTENMILCKKAFKTDFGKFLCFDTLTMVPYDKSAIIVDMLTDKELELLNRYHNTVYEVISPFLPEEESEWLLQETLPIIR